MDRAKFMNKGAVDPSKVFGSMGVHEMHAAVHSGRREPLLTATTTLNPLAMAMSRGSR